MTTPCSISRPLSLGTHDRRSPDIIAIQNVGTHSGGIQTPAGSLHFRIQSIWRLPIELRASQRETRVRARRRAGMAVAGIVGEAVKGAVREARTVRGVPPVQRAVLFFHLLGIIVIAVWGNVTLLRYAAYAYWVHATLKPWEEKKARKESEGEDDGNHGYGYAYAHAFGFGNGNANRNGNKKVAMAKNVRYGSAERNLLDVYVPTNPKREVQKLKPVVIFVHGGVWASGEKWQFSPLGAFLAEEGVVAVLVQYTLFPEALAIEQVSEVSQSLTWTMNNIAQYGGDPNRVFLMGHSSGAHLCAMVLWERASRRLHKTLPPPPSPALALDARLPLGFLGMAGVYNIGEHFKYEVRRGVGAISCMRAANGWEPQFDAMSPSLLFESLLLQKGVKFLHQTAAAGREDGRTHKADGETDRGSSDSRAPSCVKGRDLVPRCLLIASRRDITVPPTSSIAFNAMLQTLGCDTRVAMHDEMAHEDFALWHCGWGSLKTHVGPFLEEVLNFVSAVENS